MILLVSACYSSRPSSDDWICKKGKNSNGDAIQYAENIKTGEIGAYNKCQK